MSSAYGSQLPVIRNLHAFVEGRRASGGVQGKLNSTTERHVRYWNFLFRQATLQATKYDNNQKGGARPHNHWTIQWLEILEFLTLSQKSGGSREGIDLGLLGIENFAAQVGSAAAGPPEHDRRGDEDRGIGTDSHTDDQGQSEVPHAGSTE